MTTMRIETTASGYRLSVSSDAPTKRWSTDVETVPLKNWKPGDHFYIKAIPGSDFIHAKRIADAP